MIKYKSNPIKECTGGTYMKKYYNPYYDDVTVARVLDHYDRYMRRNATIRKVAEEIGYARCTVHRDLVRKLPKIDSECAKKAKRKLERNKKESVSRATRASVKKAKAKAANKRGAV